MKDKTLTKINEHLNNVISKHSWMDDRPLRDKYYKAAYLLMEEVGEIAQAINDKNYEHAKLEAYDAISVLIRIIEGLPLSE